jgi:HlyD family secretion protein
LRFKPTLARPERVAAPAVPAAERLQAGKPALSVGGNPSGREPRIKPTVWVPHEDSEPTPVEIKTGVTDGNFTELADGPLKEGQEVIVGVEPAKGSPGGAGGTLPPGFGSRPRGM